MAKRSRANAKTKPREWRSETPADADEKTKPNLRLVNETNQTRVSVGKDTLALQSIREQQRSETVLASWLPLVFAGMLGLGFAYVNSVKNTSTVTSRVTASARTKPLVSPLLESARKLTAKK